MKKPECRRQPPVATGFKVRYGAGSWLPDMDLNHDKQIQSLLCYRYTIGQSVRGQRLGIRG